MARIPAADEFVDELTVGAEIVELGRAAHQQRVPDHLLEMTVGALDRAVLMGDAAVVARRLHAVMGAQRVVAKGQILACRLVQVPEGGREAVAAMFARSAAKRPQSILEPFGKGDIALPAEDDMDMREARAGEPEVIKPMVEGQAGDRDVQLGHIGEVGQPHTARFVDLPEDDVPFRAVQRTPRANAPLDRPPDAGRELGMATLHLLEDGHRPQPRRRLQHRHDLAIEHLGQGIGPAPIARHDLLRRQPSILFKTVGGGTTERRFRRRYRGRGRLSELHVEPHLVIGDMAAGQRMDLLRDGPIRISGRSRSPDPSSI